MGNVWVAVGLDGPEGPESAEGAEGAGGTVRRSDCALLTVARTLGTPVAVTLAEPDAAAIRTLSRYGATRICHAAGASAEVRRADARQADPRSFPAAELLADLLVALAHRAPEPPIAILLPADHSSHETAARVAIRLDAGLITDAIAVRPGPVATQRCLAGSYLVESSVVRGIPVITVRPEAAVPWPAPEADTFAPLVAAELIPVEAIPLAEPGQDPDATPAPHAEVLESRPSPRADHPALDDADIVVAGGRGLGSAHAFGLVERLAEVLGGAAAGSHTAADLGWCPRDQCVGVTGHTVHPRLYLASGISGSVRHRAGMQGAGTVVAIDADPAAPLLRMADLGVVGDATRVLPALLDEIRRRRARPGP